MAKYAAASTASDSTMVADGGAWRKSGPVPLTRKNSLPESQIESPRLAKLKTVCCRFIRHATEMRSPSSARVTAPTSGPKSRTDASPKTSASEKREAIDGILMLSVPLRTVSTENRIHSGGTEVSSRTLAL